MENNDSEIEVIENQISFDFDNLNLTEQEESLSITAKPLIKSQNHDWIKDEVLFVAVKAKNYQLRLCGKQMIDWVTLAGSGCEQVILDDCDDIQARVRAINTDKKIIAVFYSDTPLLDKNAFVKILDYFASKSINFLQLNRGFIVKNDFLKYNPNFVQSSFSENGDNNLIICDSSSSISYASEVLYRRIKDYHLKNGVIIFGKETVFIDGDVEIDSGVIIYPNNVLLGESIISSGSVLEGGNTIKNSIIENNCSLCGCYIEDSKIRENSNLKFERVIKEIR